MPKPSFSFLEQGHLRGNPSFGLLYGLIALFFTFNLNSWGAPSSNIISIEDKEVLLEQLSPGQSSFQVGDQIFFKVPELSSKNIKIEKPALKENEESDWYIDPEKLLRGEVVLIPLKAGELVTPSFILKSDSGEVVGKTKIQSFQVQSAISKNDPKPEESEGVLPPLSLDFPIWFVVLIALFILIVLVGLSYLGYYFWKKRKKKNLPIPIIPEQPEEEVALQALDDLEKQGLLERGEFKKYYFKISEILKTYVGKRYGFDALESTTAEIILFFENARLIAPQLLDQLESMFKRMDLVKFTDFVPETQNTIHLINEAREWIEKTKKIRVSENTLSELSYKKFHAGELKNEIR